MIDIIIKNGTIVDGTGVRGFIGDVAICGKSITGVGRLGQVEARTVIDASGCIVAPGFIDIHSHADFSLPVLPTADSLVHQGITTAVVGQCGLSPAPLRDQTRDKLITVMSSMMGSIATAIPWDKWATFSDYIDFLDNIGHSLNVVTLVGQGVVRAGVMGFAQGRADSKQMVDMQTEVIAAMDAGAIGISTGLIYPPGSYSSTDELIELIQVVGERGGFYFSHIRGEGHTLLEAVSEAIHIGRETGTSIQISHFKAAGSENWDKSSQALKLIDDARAEGLDVATDMYPYLAGSTSLTAMLPEWAHEGGTEATLKRLANPATRTKMATDMETGGFSRGVKWDKILITGSPRRLDCQGRFVADLAAETGKTPHDWIFDALLQAELNLTMVLFGMSEDNRQKELKHPLMMIGTDGFGLAANGPLTQDKPHPRSFGTFPRVLGYYVRDEGIISLEKAVHKMTGLPAKKLRLKDRGLVQPGLAADLVVFDPATVADRATYEQPHKYAEGILHVIVNGEIVIHNTIHTGSRPGLILTNL